MFLGKRHQWMRMTNIMSKKYIRTHVAIYQIVQSEMCRQRKKIIKIKNSVLNLTNIFFDVH